MRKLVLAGLLSAALIALTDSPANLNNSTIVEAKAEPVQVAEIETAARVKSQTPTEQKTIVEPETIPETVYCGSPAQRNYKRPVRENAALGYEIAKDYGWTGSEWTALLELYSCESSWNHNAINGTSAACGIPQSYPCSKLAHTVPDYRHNVAGQITWGYDYIKARYGTPSKALAFHYRANWY